MSTPNHSPGPWSIAGWQKVIVNDSNGQTLVACPGTTIEEAQANARLIAAAPSLLAALELAEELSEQRAWQSHLEFANRKQEARRLDDAIDLLNDRVTESRRAAIAQARGNIIAAKQEET